MTSVQELRRDQVAEPQAGRSVEIQPGGYLIELSVDWIVLRASENIHHLLGESHVTLIDESFTKFVKNQALHDLRNLFSRLSGTTGIARAYAVRLTEEPDLVDIAFQLSDGRILLEAIPSSGSYGECFGTVGGLVAGLAGSSGQQSLLDGGARRMRALTGYDRVTVVFGDAKAESSRGGFEAPAAMSDALPDIVADTHAQGVGLFPRRTDDTSCADALMVACEPGAIDQLREQGVKASLRAPFTANGVQGEFRCDSRTVRKPSFELHAAAELFAQMFALRLENDALKNG